VSSKSRSGKKTPNRGWFSKGSSGNPRGRPTASPAPQSSAFDIVAEKTLTVAHHGVAREITAQEALQQRTYQNALAGKRMDQREVLKWIANREAWLVKRGPKASRPAITLHISPDPDNADAALQLLGIAAPNPARADIGADRAQLLLEPWAVQAALRRRRGGQRLTDSERDEIRRCTRDPDCLRWPRGTDE
jgi:Family of unknown function (DUF5681)